jgi:hypothetical protein
MAKRLYNVEPIERFNSKYIVDEETGCWNWVGTISTKGYGTFHINHKEIKHAKTTIKWLNTQKPIGSINQRYS